MIHVRYCPSCGTMGPVLPDHEACCPDSALVAVMVTTKVAEQASIGFKARLRPLHDSRPIAEMAEDFGAVSYSPAPLRAVRGVSFTFEQLEKFVAYIAGDESECIKKLREELADIAVAVGRSTTDGNDVDWFELAEEVKALRERAERNGTPREIKPLRQTYTFAELPITAAGYDEIATKLREAGYDHAFHDGGAIDMHGIAVTRAEVPA